MDFNLNEQQRALKETAKKFAEKELFDVAKEIEENDSPPSREILKIYQGDDLYVKDMVITEKDLNVDNGIIHSIECVMFVQPSVEDKRLDLETRNKYSITSCCMRTDLEVDMFLSDVK